MLYNTIVLNLEINDDEDNTFYCQTQMKNVEFKAGLKIFRKNICCFKSHVI